MVAKMVAKVIIQINKPAVVGIETVSFPASSFYFGLLTGYHFGLLFSYPSQLISVILRVQKKFVSLDSPKAPTMPVARAFFIRLCIAINGWVSSYLKLPVTPTV